ncbi:MAG: CAP domain-containing protein [Planctomycetes bacterium]|nr:CAP domain-containing protein [Planctomycetota bacterium]
MLSTLRSRSRRLGVLGLLLCLACGDGGLGDARRQVELGNLDTAERLIADASGVAADDLRAHIATIRAQRAALETRLAELAEVDPEHAKPELERLLAQAADGITRERIEVAISSAADRAAAQRSKQKHTAVTPFGDRVPERTDDGEPVERGLGGGDLAAARTAVRTLLERREWRQALSEVEMTLAVAGGEADSFRALKREVADGALAEAVELRRAAEDADRDGRLSDAAALLRAALDRFPPGAGGVTLRTALDEYDGRLEVLAAVERARTPRRAPRVATPAATTGASEPASGTAERLPVGPGARGAALEAGGDLAAALDAYYEAALAVTPGAERDRWIARARAAERRLRLRTEILAALAAAPEAFEGELGLLGGDATLLRTTDGPSSWDALPLRKLLGAAARAALSQEAQLGLLDERLLRGDVAGANGALATLAQFVKDGVVEERAAWEVVAAQRGEPVPDGGYVWQRGAWISRQDVLDAAQAEALVLLTKRFGKAHAAADRDAVWGELEDLGPASLSARSELLAARFDKAVAELKKGTTLAALKRVAQDRAELDHRREVALQLIFDEEKYFYPYRPPECPPEKARLYWPVQQRVDELVAAVREVWDAAKPVKLTGSFRESLADLEWAEREAGALGLALEHPAELPAWIGAVPTELDAVSLHEFAVDEAERERLAYDRAVRAWNARTWADAKSLGDDERPDNVEQRQVQITNDYRLMFGRRALAWNPKIQVAAGMHSDYMADTGDFGHFEQGDPKRRSPFDRMRLAGYENGVSENCHMGSGSPEGAHDGWCHSSGHHRNLLMPGHREMASAMTGSYWTQNFGTGRGFEAELDSWQD